MDIENRYKIFSSETEFEPGSGDVILKNKLNIASLQDLEVYETQKLIETLLNAFENFSAKQQFSIVDLCDLHKQWLGDLYEWAGNYRTVNMSKGDFLFAAAHLVPQLMCDFENDILAKYTPCDFDQYEQCVEALAIVHVEFILIHPFREGNGRLGRLLMSLMNAQSKFPIKNFELFNKNENRQKYFGAIQSGLEKNYQPMIKLIDELDEVL